MPRTDPEAIKAYNRVRAAKLYEDYVARRDALMQDVFGGQCYLCSKPAGVDQARLSELVLAP